jgi:hypothetical protein
LIGISPVKEKKVKRKEEEVKPVRRLGRLKSGVNRLRVELIIVAFEIVE